MLDMDLAAAHHMMPSFLLEKVGIKSPGSVMQMGSACFSMKLEIVISVFFYEKVGLFFVFTEKLGNFWNFSNTENSTNFANFWGKFSSFSISQKK
jgi:hypothetical protein